MAKELFIATTPHETKVAVVEDEQLAEIYFERENEYTLAGSIYKGRVTRVLPGMQSAFVDIGLERDAFLYVTDFLEEQEDQEEFEQVVSRAHSDAQQPRQESTSSVATEEQPASAGPQAPAPERSAGDQQSDRGPRRWRGRRGRRRGRGGFEEQRHDGQPQGESEAGSSSVEEQDGAEPESVLLPGESLSKYRHAETESEHPSSRVELSEEVEEPAHPAPAPAAEPRESRPVAQVSAETLPVLPGESISKYRPRDASSGESEAHPPRQESSSREPFRRGRESRWERPNRRPERAQSESEAPPSGPPVFALPGESLAKYRRSDSATPSPVARQESPARETAEDEHPATAHSFGHTEPEHDQIERNEPAPQPFQTETQTEFASPESARDNGDTDTGPHQFGSGVVEEEVIDEEEADVLPLGEHLDDEGYEELEEETLDAENAEQLVEAVREAHANQRLGLREGEPSEQEDHASTEESHTFSSDDQHPDQHMEAADVEDIGYQNSEEEEESDVRAEAEGEDAEGEEAEGEEAEGDEIDGEAGEEGRAEMRAPANTAAFQQRVERPERGAPDRFRRGRRGRPMRGRRNIQRESQPTISELLKEGQEILVQIAKEPMAKKGARITSHIALPGRFLVYMPTVNHVGVSRKIGSDEERQRLKRVLINEKGSAHGGFIVRTAAAGASEDDLRSDLRFLINLWTDIKSRSENSKAPALIYHDLNLVERILRDQVTSNFTSIWVDSELEYERIVRFLGRFQSSMVRRAKLYTKDTPLFEQFGIQEEINNALKSKVWLKSGGYIVINQTEALVAIDINTGKYVGKTQRLEDTIVKTNIDAIKEIVRQIRLRDLGGIIVIDFIDMDERKNRQKVMQALEEALKSDRAPSKVLQFNDFGLVAITRKRVKQSLERTLSTSCIYCTGTGMIKSVQTVCNEIYVEMRKMARNMERHDVMLRVNPEVVKALKANNARWLQEMEELTKKTIIVKSDPLLHQEQFDIN